MRLLSAIVARLATAWPRRGRTPAGAWLCAAVVTCAPAGQAMAQNDLIQDELRPEATAAAPLQAPLDQTIALHVSGDVGRVVVSQPETIEVGVSGPNSLFMIGRERGTTNLLVYDRDGRVSQSIDVQVGYDARGLRESLAAALPDERIDVTSLASGLVLDGEVSTAGAADVALRLAEQTAPGAVFSRLRSRGNQVSLDVRILEVSSRRLTDVGSQLGLSDGRHLLLRAGSGLIGPDPPDGMAAVHLEPGRYRLDATLNALETRGDVEVMARPTLTAVSGGTAHFRAGGEFPYPTPSDDGEIELQFKAYGTALAFQPQILPNGLIRLQLTAELSEIDTSVGLRVNGFVVPGILDRRAVTTLDLQDGESYLISGLFRDTHEDTARGVPVLSRLPLLGPLVRAVQGVEERRELAIVVTPRILQSGAPREGSAVTLADLRAPAAVSAPRGPPQRSLVQQVRRVAEPPFRWARRMVSRALGLLRPHG